MEELTQKIFDAFVRILPQDWDRFVLHMAVAAEMQTVYFFIKTKTGDDYYSSSMLKKMGIFTEEDYRRARGEASDAVRGFLSGADIPWTGITIAIDRTGKVTADPEYEEQPIVIPEEWKKKYLI